MKINDLVSCTLLLLFAIVLWTAAQALPNPGDQLYGPAFFPSCIAALIGFSSVVMVLGSLGQWRSVPLVRLEGWTLQPKSLGLFFLVPVAVIFYVFAVDALGFLATATTVLLVLFLSLGVSVRSAVAIAIGAVLLVYGIFDMALRVPLPRGTLFFG